MGAQTAQPAQESIWNEQIALLRNHVDVLRRTTGDSAGLPVTLRPLPLHSETPGILQLSQLSVRRVNGQPGKPGQLTLGLAESAGTLPRIAEYVDEWP